MPNRIIRDCCKTSLSLAAVSDLAERIFFRTITLMDDFGRYHGQPRGLMSACFPEGAPGLTLPRFEAALAELTHLDMLRFYESDGRRYVYSPTWKKHQRCRASHSKFPQPTENKGCGHLTTDVSGSRSSAAGVGTGTGTGTGVGTETDPGSFPQPDPGSHVLPIFAPGNGAPRESTPTARAKRATLAEQPFEEFWQAYPKSSRYGRAEALKAWRKLRPTAAIVTQIMRSLEAWKVSRQWKKQDGEFIPWPQKFLNRGRWKEVPASAQWETPEVRAAKGDYSGLAVLFKPGGDDDPH